MQPLRGAKVTLMRRTGAASVLTDANGSYAFRDIEPAEYRTVVTKFGYGTEGETLELRSGKTETRNFTLRKNTSTMPGAVLTTRPTPSVTGTRTVPAIQPEKPRASGNERTAIAPVRSPTGGVSGQVVDAKTGKPVAGATISIPGARGVETNQSGRFAVSNVPPGVHQMVVKRNGYADARANVTIRAGDTATLNLRLTPRVVLKRHEASF
jgi:protocatechuate 3,4-dioxygenase beta subunit